MTGYLYTPGSAGDWLVVAATGRLLLARIDGDAARAERCLAVLDAGTSVSNLVDILSSQGLESTGPFALLFWVDGDMGGKGLGVIVRGTPEVTVHSDGGDVRVVAGGFMTWSEQLVDGATGFTVETGAATDGAAAASGAATSPLDLPFTGGAVWATSVATDAAASALSGARGAEAAAQAVAQLSEVDDAIDGATVIVPTRARRREQVAANAAPEATSSTSAEESAASPAESAASPAESAANPAESDANLAESADSDVPATPVEETRVFHTTTASSAANAASAASPAGPASDADSYDYLFGATIFRPVGQAAVTEEDEEDGEATGSPASASVPASSTATAATATAATPTVAAGDHDGSTVFSTDIRQAREESRARAGASASDAPGADSDAHRSGGYVLVLPDGRSQELNAPVIIGRAPSVSNVPASVLPHLITLSADDISRNHVRIAVEGGTVVVTDLLSSNGTQVIQPGKPPLSLRGGEPTPVIVGTVVDLGSGITLTIAEA
jgi:hypothetical protein